MDSENNLKALYSYLFTIEEEIDRKLYRAKRETKRLHTIYDSIKPKEIAAKKEARDDYEILKELCEVTKQKMPIKEEAPKEINHFEIFQNEVQTFRNSPATKREQFSAGFVQNLLNITDTTTAHLQERLNECTKILEQELLYVSKLDLSKPQNAYLFKQTYKYAKVLLKQYKSIIDQYKLTEVCDQVFIEQTSVKAEVEPKNEVQTDFASFSSKFDRPFEHKESFELRNDARMAMMQSDIQNATKKLLLPYIHSDPQTKKEAKKVFTAAKMAVTVFSDPSKQWLTIYEKDPE